MSKDTREEAGDERLSDPIAEARRQWERHGWSEAAPGMEAVTTIVRSAQIVTARVEESLAPFGLTFARFEILRLLGFSRSGRLPMGKIGERLQVHPASVTSAVKRLERDGLVVREVSVADSRIVLAALTGLGRETLGPATERINEVFESLGLTDGGLDTITAALNELRAAAGDAVEGAPIVG